jgi:hypothetical protein
MEKKKTATATRLLYRKLLFFKYFVASEFPLIICEGKTDNLYVKAAIQNLNQFIGKLRDANGDLSVRFFNHNTVPGDILQLNGGTGPLKFLFRDYEKEIGRYYYAPLNNPVIVMLDSDSGASEIFAIVEQKFRKKIKVDSTDPFYHICKNLYLVKTPEGAGGKSCIEDLFDASVLGAKLNDKEFSNSDKVNPDTQYGKAAFAENVVLPNAKAIDFSKFADLLNRIVAAIDHYKEAQHV